MVNTLIVLLVLLSGQAAFAQADRGNSQEYLFSDIKFLVVQNLVEKNPADGRSRQIWVFLDERNFSERTLGVLFTQLSKKYPTPRTLDIWVETSWDSIPAPNLGGEGSAESGDKGHDRSASHWALYLRRGTDEIYRYNPSIEGKATKTVVLKGRAF
ncbi:MAG: hypothetical protein AB7J13_06585 [Pyrinomonadaceae bacterium]